MFAIGSSGIYRRICIWFIDCMAARFNLSHCIIVDCLRCSSNNLYSGTIQEA